MSNMCKVELTNGEVSKLNDFFEYLNSKDGAMANLDHRTIWGLHKIRKELKKPFQLITDVRKDLIKKYGSKQENPNDGKKEVVLSVDPKNMEFFKNDMSEILDEVVEIQIEKIKYENVSDLIESSYKGTLEFIDYCVADPEEAPKKKASKK